jgi:hypothetical protein
MIERECSWEEIDLAFQQTADSRGDQATVLYEAQVELADGPLDQEFSDPSSRDHYVTR